MSNRNCRCQDSKYQKWLGGRLVLDVVLDGIRQQESSLKVNLGENETQENARIGRLANSCQVGRDTQLCQGDGTRADPFGRVNTKGDG